MTSRWIRSRIACVGLAVCVTSPVMAEPPVLDESPAEPGEWGFQPDTDLMSAERNPPPMSWRPADGVSTYQVQIARDRAFTDVVYDRDGLPWSAHCPDQALPNGSYLWRYRAANADGEWSDWSKARRSSVDDSAVTLPQPNVAELIFRMPGSHPRLFLRPEHVPMLREKAESELAEAWADVLKRADNLLENPPDISEPPLYPPGTERKGEQWKEIWWGNRKRAIAVADGAATLAFVYLMTGEEQYGTGARDLLMVLTKWDPEGSTQYRYNDEAAMPLLYMPSRAYTWAYDALSESDREAVVKMMRTRGRQCFEHLHGRDHLWRPYSSHSNRAWHFLGEVATAFMGEIPEAETWLDFAMTVMYTAYPVWGDSDGGWHEGVAYWSSYLGRFMYWAFVIDPAYDINAFDFPYFANAGYYGMYVLPPGTKTGGFGDQAGHVGAERIGSLMRLFAAGSGNPHWAWYADQLGAGYGSGYLGFLYAAYAKDVEPKPPTDLPTSRVFKGTGLAILNTNLEDASKNVQIHFKSSPMGRQSHGYNANNAFLLNVGGEQVLLDAGRRDVHGSPHHYQYMHHSKSDNAILVNGEGQIKHSPRATGEITAFENEYVEGEAGGSYENLDSWRRGIKLKDADSVLIMDRLKAPEPSTFQFTLHARGPFEITDDGATWEGPTCKLRVIFEDSENNPLEITQTDKFDPPPAEWSNFDLSEWHLTVSTTEKRTEQNLKTVIVIEPKQ